MMCVFHLRHFAKMVSTSIKLMKFKVFTIAGQLSLVSDQLISHISLASVFRIPIYTKSSKHRSIIYSHLYVSFVGPCYISSAIDVSFSAIWAVDGCGGGYGY